MILVLIPCRATVRALNICSLSQNEESVKMANCRFLPGCRRERANMECGAVVAAQQSCGRTNGSLPLAFAFRILNFPLRPRRAPLAGHPRFWGGAG
jgi:hypothetical protein